MKRFGLPDLVGIVAALVAVLIVPGLVDPATYTKLLVLAAGGLALLPVAIWKWWHLGSVPWGARIIAGAAGLLGIWGLLSLIFSGNPLPVSLFGWWGRGDGWLALAGAISLFLAAASLDRRGVERAITWLLAGASIAALVGVLQVAGVSVAGSTGQVIATMGNINFAAGYFAMVFALALGRALTQAALWQRIWAATIAVVVAVLAWLTDSLQGPVALVAGAIAFGIIYAIAHRGRFRLGALIASGVVVAIGAILVVLSFSQTGPLSFLWAQQTFQIRQRYWATGWNMLNGLPVFGSGPDGFARYVSEFRPEFYVELLSPSLRVSAAHNIPLHIGATLGWPALILWLIVMLGSIGLLLVRGFRAPLPSPVLAGAVGGGLVAYLVQGVVSIDMLPVLATGWVVAGLTLAVARQPIRQAQTPADAGMAGQTRKAKASRAAVVTLAGPGTPIWVPVLGGLIGVAAAIAVGMQLAAVDQVGKVSNQQQATTALTSGLFPCPPRTDLLSSAIEQLPPDALVPLVNAAVALDPRCPGVAILRADVAVQLGNLPEADAATALLVQSDPLYFESWVMRGLYLVQAGDLAGAEQALAEAKRVNGIYSDPSGGVDRIAVLETAIQQAR